MTLSDLRLLLDYHYWARDRILDAVAALTPDQFTRDLGSSFRSVRDTLAHAYSAEWVWYERWQGRSPAAHVPADQFPGVSVLRTAWSAHESNVRAFLESQGEQGVDRIIAYTLFNGQPSSSTFREMLQHVVNHATYHRGQVTTMLRQLGASPAKSLDMIAFFRERARPTP